MWVTPSFPLFLVVLPVMRNTLTPFLSSHSLGVVGPSREFVIKPYVIRNDGQHVRQSTMGNSHALWLARGPGGVKDIRDIIQTGSSRWQLFGAFLVQLLVFARSKARGER
jgi:hypothetical protein